MSNEYFTIDSTRLAAVATAAQTDEQTARSYLLADWPEGAEHQQWLNNAPIRELADWLVAVQFQPTEDR